MKLVSKINGRRVTLSCSKNDSPSLCQHLGRTETMNLSFRRKGIVRTLSLDETASKKVLDNLISKGKCKFTLSKKLF